MRDDRQIVTTVCCIAALVAALAGCGGDASPTPTDDSSASLPTSSTSSVSASPTTSAPSISVPPGSSPASLADQARSAAITTYLGMWSDFTTAGHTSDWKSPLLSQHATAYALQVLEKSLYTDHNKGIVTKGAPVLHPNVKSMSPAANPTVVLVSDCGDSRHWLKYSAKTGKLISGSPGGRQAITAEVRKQTDGSWKVDQFAVEGTGTC